jgi:hypothetical protein
MKSQRRYHRLRFNTGHIVNEAYVSLRIHLIDIVILSTTRVTDPTVSLILLQMDHVTGFHT